MKKLLFIILSTLVACASGQDPKQDIRLDLSGRHLETIPDSVFNKTDLTYLDLGSSHVIFFPPLSVLVDPNSNNIRQLPPEIGNLKNLKTLILNTNKLDSLPVSIYKLYKLEVLDLALNKNIDLIIELPKLKQLKSLKVLKIAGIEPISKGVIERLKQELPNTKIVDSITEYLEMK